MFMRRALAGLVLCGSVLCADPEAVNGSEPVCTCEHGEPRLGDLCTSAREKNPNTWNFCQSCEDGYIKNYDFECVPMCNRLSAKVKNIYDGQDNQKSGFLDTTRLTSAEEVLDRIRNTTTNGELAITKCAPGAENAYSQYATFSTCRVNEPDWKDKRKPVPFLVNAVPCQYEVKVGGTGAPDDWKNLSRKYALNTTMKNGTTLELEWVATGDNEPSFTLASPTKYHSKYTATFNFSKLGEWKKVTCTHIGSVVESHTPVHFIWGPLKYLFVPPPSIKAPLNQDRLLKWDQWSCADATQTRNVTLSFTTEADWTKYDVGPVQYDEYDFFSATLTNNTNWVTKQNGIYPFFM